MGHLCCTHHSTSRIEKQVVPDDVAAQDRHRGIRDPISRGSPGWCTCIAGHFSDTLVSPMLDLSFVRENLPLVEEKLRQRGMDPAAVLKDFREVDTQRRQAITEAETSKAQRNKASDEIAKAKKAGQDASAAMAQSKELRERIQTLEKTATDLDARLRDILAGIPNLPQASVPVGHSAEDNVEVRRWGAPPKFDFPPQPHWDLGAQLGIL